MAQLATFSNVRSRHRLQHIFSHGGRPNATTARGHKRTDYALDAGDSVSVVPLFGYYASRWRRAGSNRQCQLIRMSGYRLLNPTFTLVVPHNLRDHIGISWISS